MNARATINAMRPEEVRQSSTGAAGLLLGGKYRLDEPIARGGMARVWRATHVTLNRPVAVKFIDAFGVTAEARVEGFLKEAKVAASVRHKNVVDILDFGVVTTDGEEEPYMVMELLEGQTLDDRLGEGPIEPSEVVSILLQILNGLDAVHRAGIVHRDLKPGNVFLTDDQDGLFARLLDFGISQGAGEEHDASVVVGTPEYMSPEQAFGDPLDARSDLYSVAVIAYEMLTGIVPFTDPSPMKVVNLVAHGTPPSLHALRPDLPKLCDVMHKALSRSPAERYENARAMRRALLEADGAGLDTTGGHRPVGRISGTHRIQPATLAAEVKSDPPPSEPPQAKVVSAPEATPAPKRAALVAGLAIGLVVALTLAGWLVLGRSSEAVPPPVAVAPSAPVVVPPPAPVVDVVEAPTAVEAPVVDTAVSAPVVETEVRPAARRRARERDEEDEAAAPTESEPTRARREIVHELDF